jgi:hypothetical protein
VWIQAQTPPKPQIQHKDSVTVSAGIPNEQLAIEAAWQKAKGKRQKGKRDVLTCPTHNRLNSQDLKNVATMVALPAWFR